MHIASLVAQLHALINANVFSLDIVFIVIIASTFNVGIQWGSVERHSRRKKAHCGTRLFIVWQTFSYSKISSSHFWKSFSPCDTSSWPSFVNDIPLMRQYPKKHPFAVEVHDQVFQKYSLFRIATVDRHKLNVSATSWCALRNSSIFFDAPVAATARATYIIT